ncbi:MAG: right-handed parallel beta-helix repeat-containing protein [Patescibacteria group bacterium]
MKSKKTNLPSPTQTKVRLSLAVFFAAASMIFSVLAIVVIKNNQPVGKVKMAATPATYYVDCRLSASGDGSLAAPWNNLASVSSFSFSPGSRIVFKQGTVCAGQLIINSSGNGDADAARIIFEGEGTGATIQGASSKPSGSGLRFMVVMDGKQYITIRNLKIQFAEDPVLISNSSYINLNNLTVKDSIGFGGIYVVSQNNGSVYHDKISNCNVSGITGSAASLATDPGTKLAYSYGRGIYFYGTNAKYNEISGNTATNNGDAGIVTLFASDSIIKNNTVSNNGSAGIWVGGVDGESANNLIENNTVYNNCQKIDDEFGINLHRVGNNNIVRYNKVYGQFYDLSTETSSPTICNADGYDTNGVCVHKYGSGGIRFDAASSQMSKTGNKVYYNLIYNEYIGFGNINFSGLEVYNNVISSSKDSGLNILGYNQEQANLSNNSFKNNIIYNSNNVLVRVINANISGNDFNNNIYYPDGSTKFCSSNWYDGTLSNACENPYSFSGWKSAKGETNSKAVDPLFVNAVAYNFALQAASPAKNSGVNIGLTADFSGATVPQGTAPEIGAYELGEVACTSDCTGKVCGDNGCGGSCGSCQTGQVCTSGSCVAACVPKTCAQLGKNCGSQSDGCGNNLNCGTCTAAQTCTSGVCKTKICSDNACCRAKYGSSYYYFSSKKQCCKKSFLGLPNSCKAL